MENNYEIPIVLFVFRRLDSVKLLMDIISKIKPQKLYIYADGAREGRDKEQQQVEEVRKYVCNAVNWKCESYIEFAQINKGCARNICEGLNEVFQKEEMAVIFEDDALPTEAFFQYARILLGKYKYDQRIQYIAGYNAIGNNDIINESYTFSKNAPMSGAIATWADRWLECDFRMQNWPQNKRKNRFKKYFFSLELYHVICSAMDDSYLNINDGWDYQFHHDMLDKERYAIVPKCNLVESQIYCGNAFHPLNSVQEKKVEEIIGHAGKKICFPMVEPQEVYWNREYDKLRQKLFLGINGNYFQRHKYYLYRRVKDLMYRYMPVKMWNMIKKILKS